MVRGKKIWMPRVFCQFSMSESMPAVRIKSMSEHVMTGTSHDLQHSGNGISDSDEPDGMPECTDGSDRGQALLPRMW